MTVLLTPESIVKLYYSHKLSRLDASQLGAVRRIAREIIDASEDPKQAAIFQKILTAIGD